MRAGNLFVHIMSIFRGFRKIILGVIRKWSSEAALNFEFYLSDWHPRLTQFTAVLISNTASDGDYTPPILSGGKKSRTTPAFKRLVLKILIYPPSLIADVEINARYQFLFHFKLNSTNIFSISRFIFQACIKNTVQRVSLSSSYLDIHISRELLISMFDYVPHRN